MGITDTRLQLIVAALAVALPALTVLLWRKPGEALWRNVARSGAHFAMIVLCQAIALLTVFLYVNDEYGFYASWSDLLGIESKNPEPVRTSNLHPGKGRIETLSITGAASKANGDALVWLPPQYDDPTHANERFPVVMFLPSQPSNPQKVFQQYSFGEQAEHAISAGEVAPFVAVFPPIMINPPRDTECTDVPGGPKAESWLVKDVTEALQQKYRVQPPGKNWAVMGWSTGGLCAAKLLLRHRGTFGGAVSFGGNATAYEDDTTGTLFDSPSVWRENSPSDLYLDHHGTRGGKLMLVVGEQDRSVWKSMKDMVPAVKGDPNVSVVLVDQGGHRASSYSAYLPEAFAWMHETGVLA